jgi:crotonobetainyl-CoA:carnitine CoA-transferase CaiB-like acyl-CoA transferase
MPPALLADTGAGLLAAIEILAALHAQRLDLRPARSLRLDVSMFDGAAALMSLSLLRGAVLGRTAPGLLGDYACYRTYRCRDGRFMAVASLEPEFWRGVCRTLGLDAERFVAAQWSERRQPDMIAAVEGVFATADQAHWARVFERRDLCVEPVLHPVEVARSALARARGVMAQQESAASRPSRRTRRKGSDRAKTPALFPSPRLFAASPAFPELRASRPRPKAPGLGQHTSEVLASLGFKPARVQALRDQGVIPA